MVVDLQFGIYPEYAHLFPSRATLFGRTTAPTGAGRPEHGLRVTIPGRSSTSAALSVKGASTPGQWCSPRKYLWHRIDLRERTPYRGTGGGDIDQLAVYQLAKP
jgi:hypothetical protein